MFIFFYYAPSPVFRGDTDFAKARAQEFTGKISAVQNFTTDGFTIITVLKERQEDLRRYEVFTEEGQNISTQITLVSNGVSHTHMIDRLEISSLSPRKNYFLKIWDGNKNLLDVRQFQTLDLQKKNPVIAVASCSRVGWLGHDFGPSSIWDQLLEKKPDVLLFLGDLVYPDTSLQAIFAVAPTVTQIQDRYVETWQQLRVYHQYNMYPIFSVMDDHDYGFQGANSINNKKNQVEILKLFRTFYPVPEKEDGPTYSLGPAAAFKISAFGFKIIFLDNKYSRTASGPLGIPGLIWGSEQLQWLTKVLSEDESPALIGSGTLFTFPVRQMDAAQYETPEEFNNFLNAVRAGKSKVILMSGDVHYSDVKELPTSMLGYPTYEITASRIHSISPLIIQPYFTGYVGPEKSQPIHTYEKNFVLLKPQAYGDLRNMQVEIYEKDNSKPLKAELFPEVLGN